MDTTDLLKAAMDAVRAAGVPKELQATALELAVADLRQAAGRTKPAGGRTKKPTPASRPAGRSTKSTGATRRRLPTEDADPVLARITDESAFFKKIENETGVSFADLSDIFHVEGGRLEVKVASKALGSNKRAQTQTVTALLAGAVFAGTSERKLSFGEINKICDAKHCFDSANSASSIKATSGFSTLGSGKGQAVSTRSGWQDAFAAATRRVLGKPDPPA